MRELTAEIAEWLTGKAAQEALRPLAERDLRDGNLLPLLGELRATHSEAEAAALLDQARLRQRGTDKFGALAARMLFTEEALQQASGLLIARYRAARYAPFTTVADLGCGIGGDALALAEQVPSLLALDMDPVRLLFARHNLHVAGLADAATFAQKDWTRYPFPTEVRAAFADPARRSGGKRIFSLHETEPPLVELLAVRARVPALGVKVMPGVAEEEIPPESEVEWISEGGTLKEAVLWFGALRRGPARSATVLDGEDAHTLFAPEPPAQRPITAPRAFLWEPDPTVLRATLVETLGQQLDASQLDPHIAYLTSDAPSDTPFARVWPVIEDAPFNLKVLNRRLRALEAEVVAVKKRGSPIEPERFRRRLKQQRGGRPVTLFVTRHADQPWMILCGPECFPRAGAG